MNNHNIKTIVIGLDGATFKILDPMLEKGLMPNLKELREKGSSGTLLSTFPPTTAPAWAAFMTGKDPDEHGLFDFRKPLHFARKRSLISSRDIKARKIWNILNDHGKVAALVNVPITYPPEEVHGIMISGLLTPERSSKMIYPASMYDDFIKTVPDYEIDIMHTKNWQFKGYMAILKKQREILTGRIEACKYVMKKLEWDFFMVVLEDMDRIQHILWNCFDKESEYKHLELYYSFIDSKIGELIEDMKDRCNIILLSDHGFTRKRKLFYVNNWLNNIGLFECKKRERSKGILRRLDIFNLRRNLRKTIKTPNLDYSSQIIWENTKAYSGNWSESGIFINLCGREPFGIVSDAEYDELRGFIIKEIAALSNGEDGRIIKRAFRREERYSGRYSNIIPDVLLEVNDDFLMDENVSYGTDIIAEAPYYKSSGHDENGIVVIYGQNIKGGKEIFNAHIRDLAPTILYMYGVHVPEDMQGKVIKEIIV